MMIGERVNDWIATKDNWTRMIKRNHLQLATNPYKSAQIALDFCADSLRTEVQMDTTVSA